MSIQLNHTVVHAKNQRESAEFLAEILGLDPPGRFSHFHVVQLDNGVSMDYMEASDTFDIQHYAFLVSDDEFDQIFGRIKERGMPYWADPYRTQPNAINTNDGGRGVYFLDPSGHILEIITKPYGSGG